MIVPFRKRLSRAPICCHTKTINLQEQKYLRQIYPPKSTMEPLTLLVIQEDALPGVLEALRRCTVD